MHFKTRKQLLQKYNEEYPHRTLDIPSAMKQYFKDRKWNYEKAVKKAVKRLHQIEEEREYETIHITMYEYTMKTDRPRVYRGHAFSPNAAANHDYFEKAFKQVVKVFQLINTPAEVYIDAYLEMPHDVPAHEVLLFESRVLDPITYPDYDNIGKCYTDMFKYVISVDDDLFHVGQVRKFFSIIPRVEITIRYIKKHESDYIYRKIKNRKSVKELVKAGLCEVKRIGES